MKWFIRLLYKHAFLGAKIPSIRGIYEPKDLRDIQSMTKNNLHE